LLCFFFLAHAKLANVVCSPTLFPPASPCRSFCSSLLDDLLDDLFRDSLREIERAAEAFRMQLQYLDIRSAKDIETAFREANKERAEAVFLLRGLLLGDQSTLIAEHAVKSRLPAMYPQSGAVERGGLMSYGVNQNDLERRAATYVDKILKGRTPADLPVERPMKFEFVINLKAAKQIGLTVPPNVLVRADRVIR
ncbi:MAG: hypothetical protein EXR70_23620, partial [Deltaproteobacteria bacterium]|nr:hypothetical protein [Deltaproteobacteria bacterium]